MDAKKIQKRKLIVSQKIFQLQVPTLLEEKKKLARIVAKIKAKITITSGHSLEL